MVQEVAREKAANLDPIVHVLLPVNLGMRAQVGKELERVKEKIAQPDNVALRDEAGAFSLRLGHNREAGRWLRCRLPSP